MSRRRRVPAGVAPADWHMVHACAQELTAEQVEEARLRAKYGGAVPKKKGNGLLPVGRKARAPARPATQT